jgi:hypothetical protein
MSGLLPFSPGQTIKVTAATASAAKAFVGDGPQVEIYNASANLAAVAIGTSAVVAVAGGSSFAASCYPVPPNSVVRITRGGETHIAYIRDAGSDATLYITVGAGG